MKKLLAAAVTKSPDMLDHKMKVLKRASAATTGSKLESIAETPELNSKLSLENLEPSTML